MKVQSRWRSLPLTYREREVKLLAKWVVHAESGSVVGLPGSGRSTLLNVLVQRPDILAQYLPGKSQDRLFILAIDLNILPDNSVNTLYRVWLRAFFMRRGALPAPLAELITVLFQAHLHCQDTFINQSVVLEFLTRMQQEGYRVICILNRFDEFYLSATEELVRTLKGIRDQFRDTLFYFVGMKQEANEFDISVSADVRAVYDTNVCWVRPLDYEDTGTMVVYELTHFPLRNIESVVGTIWTASGGFPFIVRLLCQHILMQGKANFAVQDFIYVLREPSFNRRLLYVWEHFSQAEKFALSQLAQQKRLEISQRKKLSVLELNQLEILQRLETKGICEEVEGYWRIVSNLVQAFVLTAPSHGLGKIWYEPVQELIFQGQTPLKLTPVEQSVLSFFVQNPYERHTHDQIIDASWSEEAIYDGVTPDSLYQVIRGLRAKIEPSVTALSYILTWRGQGENGYQFFPEGRPRIEDKS